MLNNWKNRLVAVAVIGFLLPACKKWDDHNRSLDEKSDKTLLQQINENSNLSKFASLLVKSGYDKEVGGSKTYTVYAPTNDALGTLDPAIENDAAKLKQFVGNHIATLSYYAATTVDTVRIPMLSSKYHNIFGKKIDDANITTADLYAKNGVVQVIDKTLPYLQNSWDFIENDTEMPLLQKTYIISNYYNVLDLTNAVQIGVDTAGRPIYQPGTDSVRTNIFWNTAYDVKNEAKQYTTFVLADAAWAEERARLIPYYTDSLGRTYAAANMIRDYAIEGSYSAAELPDTIVSRYNVKLGIDKGSIVKSIKTSNGYVHIMSKLTVRLQDKFKPIIIQAENYSFTSASRPGNIYKRELYDTAAQRRFIDILVYNHGLALFNLGYRVSAMPGKIKFRASWVAVNNNINGMTAAFTQKLGIDTATSTKFFGYTNVPLNSYKEQVIGDFTLPEYRSSTTFFLTAANSTTANTSAIVCDYIKLEPIF